MDKIKKIIKEETRKILMEYGDTFKNPNIANKIEIYANEMQDDLNKIINDGVHSKRDIVLLNWQKAINGLKDTAKRIR
jgi:hypothetical protein